MSNLSVQGRNAATTRGVTYDAGEQLKRSVDSILTDDSNPHIDSMVSSLEGTLRRNGVSSTRWVGQMLYAFRGVQQGVPGDVQSFKKAVAMAQRAGALGPRGAASLLAKVGVLDNQRNNDNSIISTSNPRTTERKKLFDSMFENPIATPPSERIDFFQRKPATKRPQSVQAQPEKKGEVSPALELAITGVDAAAKAAPEGALKSALEAVLSSLELAKEAQKNRDGDAYARSISDLGSKTFALAAALVKTYGQNPALARLAGRQLGKLGGVLGKVAGPWKVLDNASKIVNGTTLGGTKVDNNERADAVVDLVANRVAGPVGAAIVISKAELEWIYNNIGVPAHRAIESYGLRQLFSGKTADQMRAQVNALPTTPDKAKWTLDQLFSKTFKGGSFNGTSTASSLWDRFKASELQGYNDQMTLLNTYAKTKPGENPLVDDARTAMAERYKSAALRFIDQQVSEARANW